MYSMQTQKTLVIMLLIAWGLTAVLLKFSGVIVDLTGVSPISVGEILFPLSL